MSLKSCCHKRFCGFAAPKLAHAKVTTLKTQEHVLNVCPKLSFFGANFYFLEFLLVKTGNPGLENCCEKQSKHLRNNNNNNGYDEQRVVCYVSASSSLLSTLEVSYQEEVLTLLRRIPIKSTLSGSCST